MISKALLYFIGSRLYRRRQARMHAGGTGDRGDSAEWYWRWQYESSRRYFALFGDLMAQIRGKRILDLGCGLGGRTCYLAGQGVGEIIGTDINAAEIEAASRLAVQNLSANEAATIRFVAVDEKAPTDLGTFDIVLLIDSMEHFRDPVAILNLAYHYLSPGGLCYFSTMGWYHHRGSHVNSIIPLPFVNVFFSDRTILDVIRRVVSSDYYEPSQWDSVPPVKRWVGVDDLQDRPGEYLNKITIAGIYRAVNASLFERSHIHIEGFSSQRLKCLSFLNVLTQIPGFREVYHGGVFGRLQRGR